ncbi:MAG: CPBP family intramembrane metalloprotease, partial [Microlunatus sp.]|nr:CPBP family intramembrane metalloprotease [Microlunatus sp.]
MDKFTKTTDQDRGGATGAPRAEPTGPTDHAGHTDRVSQRSRRWLRVLAIVGPVLALYVAAFLPAGLSMLLPPLSGDASAGVVVVFVVVQSLVVCLIAIGLCAVLVRIHGLRLRDAGLRWTRTSGLSLLLGLAVGAVVLLGVGVLLTAAQVLRPGADFGLPWWALVSAGLAQALFLQGFPEELLFRGYQMTALRARPAVALVISSAVFAVINLRSRGGQENALERVLYLAMPFGFAIAAGALMILTGSLWADVGVHAGLHVGSLIGVLYGLG